MSQYFGILGFRYHGISISHDSDALRFRDFELLRFRAFDRPTFRYFEIIGRLPIFGPIYGRFLFAIRYRKWSFSEANGLPLIFLKFWAIAGNLPLSDDVALRTLIAASNAPFWHHFSPPDADHFWAEIWSILTRG